MPTITRVIRIPFLRGTTAQNDTYVGNPGEITIDSTLRTIRVHDGIKRGGERLLRLADMTDIVEPALSTALAYRDRAIQAETNASASAAAAATSEANASASASSAAASAAAADDRATFSDEKATISGDKAAIATTQANSASASAATASTQAGIATTQAGIATTQAGVAATQANSANASATTASTQAGIATTQAGIATTQAGIAATQAGAASASAATATSQAGIATTQAGIATTKADTATAQAGIATTQAGIATTQAGAASTSAAAALASQTAAASSEAVATQKASQLAAQLYSFNEMYLGQRATNPTTDGNGNALKEGAIYQNTTDDKLYSYENGVWTPYDAESQQQMNNALLSAQNAAGAEANALSYSNAAGASAATATSQAGIATTQAGIAATKADTATTQAGIATTQAGIATTKADTATTQAGISTTQAGIATTKADTATTQAGIATTQAGVATTQAGIATTQASAAAASATTATNQSGIATTQAGIAAAQAGIATTQASAASASAAAAATSETAAASSASAAASSASQAAATLASKASLDGSLPFTGTIHVRTNTVIRGEDGDGNFQGSVYWNSNGFGLANKLGDITILAKPDGTNWLDGATTVNGALTTGSVSVTGATPRIRADFTNGTLSSRLNFQTATADSFTSVGIIPNGTSTTAILNLCNNSNPDVSSYLSVGANISTVFVNSKVLGGAPQLPISFQIQSAEKMRLTPDGDCIIGKTSAIWAASNRRVLEIEGASEALIGLTPGGGGRTYLWASSTGVAELYSQASLVLSTGAGERFRVDSNGTLISNNDLIVRNTSPGVGSLVGAIRFRGYTGYSSPLQASIESWVPAGSVGVDFQDLRFNTVMGDGIYERLRITPAGTVLVGPTGYYGGVSQFETAPFSSGGLLEIRGDYIATIGFNTSSVQSAWLSCDDLGNFNIVSNGGFVTVGPNSAPLATFGLTRGICLGTQSPATSGMVTAQDIYDCVVGISTATGGTASAFVGQRSASDGNVALWKRGSTTVGTISVTTNATSYNTTSDYRLKTVIGPINDALGSILALNPVTFTWKSDGMADEGFLAHEYGLVFPHGVSGAKDAVDEEGNPIYQGIDKSYAVPRLVAALQQLAREFHEYRELHP